MNSLPSALHRSSPLQPDHLVFVYGTLKSGCRNHGLLERIEAKLIASAITVSRFPLVVHNLPYLLDRPGEGKRVEGEIYSVCRPGLHVLDRLEGHPHWYQRRRTRVLFNKTVLEPWAYFLSHIPKGYQSLSFVSKYSDPHHVLDYAE